MIIDVHHHIIPNFPDEASLSFHAGFYYKAYGPGGRSERVDVSLAEVKGRLRSYGPDPDGNKLRQRMATAGIDLTLMCLTDNVETVADDQSAMATNRALAEFAGRSKGKVIALAGIDPRRKKAPDLYRRCVEEYGMRGLKWHPDFGFYPNSDQAFAMLRVAEELGTPLLTHTGPLPGLASGVKPRAKYAHVSLLDEVAQDFPGLKIIAAHMGRHEWRLWAQLAQYRPNLYGDLAMWQIFAVASYDRFCRNLRDMLDIAGADSILFGTDAPGFSALVPNERFVQIIRDLPREAPAGIKFTEEEVAAILGGNAQTVFGIRG